MQKVIESDESDEERNITSNHHRHEPNPQVKTTGALKFLLKEAGAEDTGN